MLSYNIRRHFRFVNQDYFNILKNSLIWVHNFITRFQGFYDQNIEKKRLRCFWEVKVPRVTMGTIIEARETTVGQRPQNVFLSITLLLIL